MMPTRFDAVLATRAIVERHRVFTHIPIGMAMTMNWVARFEEVNIWRIGPDYFIATCPARTREGFPVTEISDPIRCPQDAADWLAH